MILRTESLVQGHSDRVILDGLDIEAHTGEVLTVLGPNGSGKSTLIKTICNLADPISGDIFIDDRNLKDYSRKELSRIIGYVPQNYAYMQHMTALDTVLLGRKPYMEWNYSDEDFEIVEESMDRMNVLDLADRNMNELSGGQMQRVFIARTLSQRPRFYMFDEPTSSLDLRHQIDTMKTMEEIVHSSDSGMIIALHDLNLALRYSDKILMIKDKKVYDYGTPDDVITEQAIMDVYGVKAKIIDTDDGRFMLPIDSLGW